MYVYVIKVLFGLEVEVVNLIIDLYFKCGLMEVVDRFFSEMFMKNRVFYIVMIIGYGKYGFGKEVVNFFNKMFLENIKFDSIIYLVIFLVCSYLGLIEEC